MKWVAKPSDIGGCEAYWTLMEGGVSRASIHRYWGNYLGFLGSDMHHSACDKTIGECARKVEKLLEG